MKAKKLMGIGLLALAGTVLAPAGASASEHDEALRLREAGEILPLTDILAKAAERRPGKVIEAELERERAGYIYEVEILDAEGIVWELKFDARSGELVKEKQER